MTRFRHFAMATLLQSNPSVLLLSARLPVCINLTLLEKLQSVSLRQVRTMGHLLL
jgi:hypothetical protein